MRLISVDDPINAAVRHSLRASDIPRCVPLDRAWSVDVGALEFHLIASCPRFAQWSVDHYTSWYVGFLASHPGNTRLILADLLPYSVSWSLKEQGVFAVVPPLSDAIWGSNVTPSAQVNRAAPSLRPLGFEDPVYAALLAANVGGAWLVTAHRRSRRTFGAERRRLCWCLLYVIDAAACVIIWQMFFLPSSDSGMARIAIEASALMRVSLILAFGLAVPWLHALRIAAKQGGDSGIDPAEPETLPTSV